MFDRCSRVDIPTGHEAPGQGSPISSTPPVTVGCLVSSSGTETVPWPLTSQALRLPNIAELTGEWVVQTGASPGALVAVVPLATSGLKLPQLADSGTSVQGLLQLVAKI